MLEKINTLAPFIEDCYQRISVREFARLQKTSPPTASKLLQSYQKEGLLKKEEDRGYYFFFANKENQYFKDLSRIYWRKKLEALLEYLEKEVVSPTVILFGSLAKAEAKNDSDIDLVIIAKKREIDLKPFEKTLKRVIQVLWSEKLSDIKSKELQNNIINGYILSGRVSL